MAGTSLLEPPVPVVDAAASLELRVCPDAADAASIHVPQGSVLLGADAEPSTALGGETTPHVLVIHGSCRTIVRSLGPTTLLNGRPFHEALLHGGDRLSIGPTEVEVHCRPPREDAGQPSTPGEAGDEPGSATVEESSRHGGHQGTVSLEALEERFLRMCEDHDQMARERQRWLGGWNQAEAQLNTCVEQIHRKMAELREEHDAAATDLMERRRELLQDHDDLTQRFATLDRRLEEFAAQQEAILAERLAWQEEQRRLHEQLLTRSNQIDRKLDTLAARQQALEAKRPHAAAVEALKSSGHRDAIDFRLAELRAEREALEEDLRWEQAERARTFLTEPATDAASESPAGAETLPSAECKFGATPPAESEESSWEESASQASPPPAAFAPAIADEPDAAAETFSDRTTCRWTALAVDPVVADDAGEREAELTGGAESAQATDTRRAEVDELAFAPPRPAAPATTAEVFARLGLRPLTDDDPVPVAPPARMEPTPEPAAAEREDESIDQYMVRLMDRVRVGAAPSSAAARPQLGRRTVDAESPERSAPALRGPEPPPRSEPQPVEPPQPRVRVAPPESADRLSAMRELANMNARQAVSSHQQRRMTSLMYGKLLLAVVSMVVSFTMIAMAAAGRPLYVFGALLAATMTGVWSWQYLKLARQLAQAAEQAAVAENKGPRATGDSLGEAVSEPQAAEIVLDEALRDAQVDEVVLFEAWDEAVLEAETQAEAVEVVPVEAVAAPWDDAPPEAGTQPEADEVALFEAWDKAVLEAESQAEAVEVVPVEAVAAPWDDAPPEAGTQPEVDEVVLFEAWDKAVLEAESQAEAVEVVPVAEPEAPLPPDDVPPVEQAADLDRSAD